jgi:hypothetical protein
MPETDLVDYRKREDISEEHQAIAEATGEVLAKFIDEFNIHMLFSHDLIFTGWNLPYGIGIKEAGVMQPRARWMHWIHSIPTARTDEIFNWWNIREYGKAHKLIFPNNTERRRVAEQFQGEINDVRVIPHIKDPRTWWDFCEDTINFLDDFPEVMQADIIQVYPASTDRLTAKRVHIVTKMFGEFKKRGFKVALIIANQWATGTQRKEDLVKFYKRVRLAGLKINEEVIFTSEWQDEFATGIPRRMVRELMLISNMFIFPTREESFGLVGPEAALSGCYMVLNKSLDLMQEVHGLTGLFIDFGGFANPFEPANPKKYYEGVSQIILGRMRDNEVINSMTFHRKAYNYDNLYNKAYLPTMMEAATWTTNK